MLKVSEFSVTVMVPVYIVNSEPMFFLYFSTSMEQTWNRNIVQHSLFVLIEHFKLKLF